MTKLPKNLSNKLNCTLTTAHNACFKLALKRLEKPNCENVDYDLLHIPARPKPQFEVPGLYYYNFAAGYFKKTKKVNLFTSRSEL